MWYKMGIPYYAYITFTRLLVYLALSPNPFVSMLCYVSSEGLKAYEIFQTNPKKN